MHRPGVFVASIVGDHDLCHVVNRHGSGEPAVLAIAHRQLELFTARQAQAVGLSPRMLAARHARGVVSRLHLGVYVWGSGTLLPGARELAGCLACPGAVTSHESAALLWGLMDALPEFVHVSIAERNYRSRPGLRVHRTHAIGPADVSEICGIPITSPARTLVDRAAMCDSSTLERELSEAFARRLVTEETLRAAIARSTRRAGVPVLRALLEGGAQVTRSEAERMLLALIRSAGLPMPRTNVRVAGYVVDALWTDQKLVVEIDGFAVHGHRRAFERDRARDQALLAAGYRVMRITWRQLAERSMLVAANLAAALARAR